MAMAYISVDVCGFFFIYSRLIEYIQQTVTIRYRTFIISRHWGSPKVPSNIVATADKNSVHWTWSLSMGKWHEETFRFRLKSFLMSRWITCVLFGSNTNVCISQCHPSTFALYQHKHLEKEQHFDVKRCQDQIEKLASCLRNTLVRNTSNKSNAQHQNTTIS